MDTYSVTTLETKTMDTYERLTERAAAAALQAVKRAEELQDGMEAAQKLVDVANSHLRQAGLALVLCGTELVLLRRTSSPQAAIETFTPTMGSCTITSGPRITLGDLETVTFAIENLCGEDAHAALTAVANDADKRNPAFKIEIKTMTIHFINGHEVAKAIEKATGHYIDPVASGDVVGDESGGYIPVCLTKEDENGNLDRLEYEKFLQTGKGDFQAILQFFLQGAARRGELPFGEYNVQYTWG